MAIRQVEQRQCPHCRGTGYVKSGGYSGMLQRCSHQVYIPDLRPARVTDTGDEYMDDPAGDAS